MWVVKLGGSLAGHERLQGWLSMLADVGRGRVLVVPGGGSFADTVRQAQDHWRFDDVCAHNMAVLAMAQTAYLLHALERRLVLANDDNDMRQALRAGHVALWRPFGLLRDASDALTTWDVTSDSLALWLARRLNAERLVVVKACTVPERVSLDELSAGGAVDARFPHWARDAPFPIEVVGPDHVEQVRERLLGGPSFGQAGLARDQAPPRSARRGSHPARARRKLPP